MSKGSILRTRRTAISLEMTAITTTMPKARPRFQLVMMAA